MELSLIELWRETGPVARAVVGVLAGMSVTAGAIAVEKWLRVRRAEVASRAFLTAWRREARDPAAVCVLAGQFPASPVAGLVAAAAAAAEGQDEHRSEIHDRTVRRYVIATGSDLRRGLATIATIGSTAPFVGLFGTVIGIVNAFHEMGATGHGGIAVVSTGIAEALITTAFGIMVAIPAVWLFNALGQRITRLVVMVECAGEELAIGALAASGGPGTMPRTPSVPSWG